MHKLSQATENDMAGHIWPAGLEFDTCDIRARLLDYADFQKITTTDVYSNFPEWK